MPDPFQIINLVAIMLTLCLLLYHVGQLRRYFRLTQERFHLQNERITGYHRRILSLEQERRVREAINPWKDGEA